MAQTKRFPSTKSKNVRWDADGSDKQGCDRDQHLLTGTTGSGSNAVRHRAMIEFDHDWTGVGRIVNATLYVMTERSSTHYEYGTAPRVRVHRATEEWSSVASSEDVWTAGMYQAISSFGGYADEQDVPALDDHWVGLDVTRLMQYVAPSNVLMPDGNPGQGGDNNGFVLLAPGDENITKQRAIFKSRYNTSSAHYPYIDLTYDPPNRAPVAPTLFRPATTGSVGFDASFEGTHSDPDGDALAGRYINVYLAGSGTLAWTLPVNLTQAGSEESQTGTFSVPLSLAQGSLKYGTNYEWTAATKDVHGRVGPHSARRALRITSLAPTVGIIPWATIYGFDGPKFGGTYIDPEGNPISLYHIQMRSQSAHTDVAFSDQNAIVWDTGETYAGQVEKDQGGVSIDYAGRTLSVGNYTYRYRAQNLSRQWSPWVYDDFTLASNKSEPTAPGQPGYPPPDPTDPLELDYTTQIDRRAPVRIALTKMGTARGPSSDPSQFIGFIDDPIELGASAFLNGGGELYFTLPALHPYCPEIEPHRVHYRVEQWYGDRYRALFFGIITDFDAGPDEVVFYGTDYLGLLQTAVDERFTGDAESVESEKPASGTGTGGSKYSKKKLDFIIKDQLLYHKGLTNSPVGFINVGPISALAEEATIYSTYTEALPFIIGLIDSHKQGTGREARFYARPTNVSYTAWEWVLRDDWGIDRPNIRLEYGSLVNDFRVVALGDFGTRVLGIGSKRGEVRVFRATGQSELSEAHFGRRSKVTYHADIIDTNDLTRRVKEQATQLAKVGKRIAMAIRADSLIPFDGWDLGDSIVIDIVRGVVDTKQYGTDGLWTVYGVEYRYSPDGHTDLTLTLMPKKTLTSANPDLIPSINPGLGKEWQVGYGVPTTYGEPPSNTPTLLRDVLPLSTDAVISKHYEDLNTGCIYELDEDTGLYFEAYCPPPTPEMPEPVPPDTTAPPPPVIKSLTSNANQQQDGGSIVALTATVGYATPPAGMTDLDVYELEVTFRGLLVDPTQPDWTTAVTWVGPSADHVGATDTVIVVPGVLAATQYWVRVSATDKSGNRSGWSGVSVIQSAGDNQAPPLPTGVVAVAGNQTIGVRWAPASVLDLDYTEVQYRVIPAGNWVSVRVGGTMTVITGLANDTPSGYEVRLRSVDTSGNVLRDLGGGVFETIKVDTDPNAGWVTVSPNPKPSPIPGDALVWNEAMFQRVFAGWISADMITSGTLRVGQGAGKAAAITVLNAAGTEIGKWNHNGIEITDPTNTGYKMFISNATLTVWAGYGGPAPYRAVHLSPLGIDAASITFGTARGGHNLIQNSSFELGRFIAGTPTPYVWDDLTDYNASGVSGDNVIVSGNYAVMQTI